MEVTSTLRGNSRLLQSVASTFSVAADNQVNNFELLLELPTCFECCPVEVDESLPPESVQTEPNSDSVTASEDNSLKDSPQANSDEDDDRQAEGVASELAVIQAPLPGTMTMRTPPSRSRSQAN